MKVSRFALIGLSLCGMAQTAAAADRKPPEAVYYANSYADHDGVPRALVYSIIDQESGWNPRAVSPKGALGLMQLMPPTARAYGAADPFSISDNIGAGVHFLADLIAEFHGDFRLAVAAYYRGGQAIKRRGLQYSNPDVYRYVSSVRRLYSRESARQSGNDLAP